VGAGLTIWHWGPIIVNPNVRIGEKCTLNPMVIIGHKNEGEVAPKIGNNVFIGGGAKVIGDIIIGDNVTIAPNAVVVKDVKDNCVVGGVTSKVLKKMQ
jgi:serine O-acetyltransferase